MTIDPTKIKTAKEWAESVRRHEHEYSAEARAAAEVIRDLPKVIVDGEAVRELIEEWELAMNESMIPVEIVSWGAVEAIRSFLPAPKTPTVEIKFGAWAMHPEYGEGIIASTRANGNDNVQFLYPNGWGDDGTGRAWISVTDLSPLPDPDTETTTDPEPQPGEAWLVDYGEGQTVALFGKSDFSEEPLWFTDDGAGYALDWADPVVRLVPEVQSND